MKLTKTSVHAVLAVAFLADCSPSRPVRARQVGEYLGVPTDSALKVLQTLVRQNILRSQLGRSGGYRLHHDPADVNLLQIIEAIDGPIGTEIPELGFALDLSSRPIEALYRACDDSAQRFREQLVRVTVLDLLEHETADTTGLALAG